MAYVHVAHDCHVGSDTIFGPGATLGGHVTVDDFATISAYSGVHQFCRVGRHAFIGGYSVVTKDALPFAKTVGRPRAVPRLRAEHHRPGPPRLFAGHAQPAEACLPLPAALEAERHAGAAADRERPEHRLPGGRAPRRLHPLGVARRHPQARQGRATRNPTS